MFERMKFKKSGFQNREPATFATSATQGRSGADKKGESSESSGSSNPPASNSHFCDSLSCDGLGVGTAPEYREGTPYPDSQGMVKCVHCLHCEIRTFHTGLGGTRAKCLVSGDDRTRIALLVECRDFVTKTVH